MEFCLALIHGGDEDKRLRIPSVAVEMRGMCSLWGGSGALAGLFLVVLVLWSAVGAGVLCGLVAVGSSGGRC